MVKVIEGMSTMSGHGMLADQGMLILWRQGDANARQTRLYIDEDAALEQYKLAVRDRIPDSFFKVTTSSNSDREGDVL